MAKAQTKKKKPAAAKTSKPAAKSYPKKPMWQWIVIYTIIGIIVYLIIYLWFFGGSGASTY